MLEGSKYNKKEEKGAGYGTLGTLERSWNAWVTVFDGLH